MSEQQQHPALADIRAADLTTLNTSCRILIVSPSILDAMALIRRIQALGGSTDIQPEESGKIGNDTKDPLSPDLVKIPWTIENKYYSADVHFAVHPMRGLAPYLLQNIPAVIFVWGSNKAYKHHLNRISRDLGGYEPEVSLAVRVKASSDVILEEEEAEEDNASIDESVSRFGFEYVDATLDITNRQEERDYEGNNELDGIPNLPRVLDALSTIMWPSMKGHDRSVKYRKGLAQPDPDLFKWGTGVGTDRSLSLVNDLMAFSNSRLSANTSRMQSEMEELSKWLEDGVQDGDREDPWRMAVHSDTMVASPTESKFSSVTSWEKDEEQTKSLEPACFARFDDDFTVYVSAPSAEDPGRKSGHSTPGEDGSEGHDGLKPPFVGMRTYNSLGSVSDFGESGGGQEISRVISDDEDESLPTQEEILETSSRIFGQRVELPSIADSLGSPKLGLDEKTGVDETQLDGEDEYDVAPFDLSKVLGALQQMKEEISGMENEDERRKAAARVALGLVYGLDAKGDF